MALSGQTSETCILCYFSQETAVVYTEEGADDVKSAWLLRPGQHTCYNGENKELLNGNVMLISQKSPQYGLRSAIRPHEVGIASNRGSAHHGEYVLESCTHRPSSEPSRRGPNFDFSEDGQVGKEH